MTEPVGYECPGCGQPPAIALSGQAWCGNEDCHVLAWNPARTLEELAEQALRIIELPREDT